MTLARGPVAMPGDQYLNRTGGAGEGARRGCTAMPAVADRVRAAFADVLDSPSGRYAQLVAAADIVVNMAYYQDPVDLCPALPRLAADILG
jgi:hypothetical protein